MIEVERELAEPEIWSDTKRAQALGKERVFLEKVVHDLTVLQARLQDAAEWIELVVEEQDAVAFQELQDEVIAMREVVEKLEFQRMFAGEMDHCTAFLDIQAGSGGTESQDWANMLLRMYFYRKMKR